MRDILSIVAFAAAMVAVTSPCHATISLAEFDSQTPQRQAQILGKAVTAYYHYYMKSADTEDIAHCMETLYKPREKGTAPPLVTLIFNDLDRARADSSRNYSIEGIVQGVIERECAAH